MKHLLWAAVAAGLSLAAACSGNRFDNDASGVFEATETIVPAEASGVILRFDIVEGTRLAAGSSVGYIDTVQLHLKRRQLLASRSALAASRPDTHAQLEAARAEVERAWREKSRIENLLAGGAATQQQLDEITTQLSVARGRLEAQRNNLATTTGNIDRQIEAIDIQVAQTDDMIRKSYIVNPVEGTVLAKYTEPFEMATPGRPLYKIADIRRMFLRAYITADQFASIQIGQTVKVFTGEAGNSQTSHPGTITWISDNAEFTPKTIQTRDERANLVYAIKIAVQNNDGKIKIGMYGEVKF